ncbi:hypothetical protein P3S68_021237 [Capsicum galapagoense]
MDDTLVDAYCHEDALGHRVGGTFTTLAMDNIVKELRSKFSNKSGMSGFAWDPITHKWDAKPEVWAQLIQVKPQAAELKNKSFQHYEKLVTLYGKDRATGKHAETDSDMLKRTLIKIQENQVLIH